MTTRLTNSRGISIIKLTIEQKVIVTESFYPKMSTSELFSNLGGVLGLWLGVGMIQIVDQGFVLILSVLTVVKKGIR